MVAAFRIDLTVSTVFMSAILVLTVILVNTARQRTSTLAWPLDGCREPTQ
jgi:hypothetical protein